MSIQITPSPTKQKIIPPKKWGVFLINDDHTTMEFVVWILEDIFNLSEQRAHFIMMTVHQQGKALCGTYSREIAETKQQQVLSIAHLAGFPLMCTVEQM